MKSPTTNRLTGIAAVLPIILISFSGCFQHFYKTNTVHTVSAATLQKLQSGNKYFILHADNGIFALKNIKVNNDILDGDLDTVTERHLKYLEPKPTKVNFYSRRDKKEVLYEVHLYAKTNPDANAHISLALNSFNRLDVYELDKGATTRSTVFSILGLTVLTAGVGVAIVAIACNCPQVYTYNGNNCEFTGGLYSGAIYASLERTDYMPLRNIQPGSDQLRLQISGVHGEEQIINEMKLLEVVHNSNESVLPDRYGNMIVYRQPIAPIQANISENKNVLEELSKRDGNYYSFTNNSASENTSDVILDFKKPAGSSSGNLVIRAKNSGWSGYLFHEFKSLFGDYYAAWTQKKDKSDPKEMQQWQIDQSLPLLVSVKEGNTWKYVDYFITPGNTAERDMIMKINLAGFENTPRVQVRLQTAYMFWDLDYAGMDFSDANDYATRILPAKEIIKSDHTPQEEQLGSKDKSYTHLTDKENLMLTFTLNQARQDNKKTSYFLMSSGYYHINKNFEGKPQVEALKTFLHKGAFDKFSRQKFEQLQNTLAANAASAGISNK